jgi:preprotein translocase subunit SecY
MPYITASIIIQLMGAVVPYFQKLQREGEEGRRRITQLTRYGTIGITALQSIGYSINLLAGATGRAVVINSTLFTITTVIVLTSGTAFVMWLGERISEDGIGNGISLIIMIGIIAFLPQSLMNEISLIGDNIFILLVEIGIWVLVTGSVVLVSQGMRRIPVQYAKRVTGRKVQGGTTQYLPLRVNAAGVMPIIFAQSIMFIPSTIASFFPNNPTMQQIGAWFSDISSLSYSALFFVVVVFFTYFYTAITVNPQEMADTMKRQGGFIPGIRPGKQTSEFIDTILTRITLPGSLFLGLVAIFPAFAMRAGVSQGFAMFYGGTSLLILVQVTLDTLQQIESHLLMRHYDGFMKSGQMRSPRQGGGI